MMVMAGLRNLYNMFHNEPSSRFIVTSFTTDIPRQIPDEHGVSSARLCVDADIPVLPHVRNLPVNTTVSSLSRCASPLTYRRIVIANKTQKYIMRIGAYTGISKKLQIYFLSLDCSNGSRELTETRSQTAQSRLLLWLSTKIGIQAVV